jgi:hypothetical protein
VRPADGGRREIAGLSAGPGPWARLTEHDAIPAGMAYADRPAAPRAIRWRLPAVTDLGEPAAAFRDQLSLAAASSRTAALSRRMWKNGDRKMKRADSIMTRPRPMMPISDQICG